MEKQIKTIPLAILAQSLAVLVTIMYIEFGAINTVPAV
jgi:hypothetical protein